VALTWMLRPDSLNEPLRLAFLKA